MRHLNYVKEIIGGRDVALVIPGHSLVALEDWIDKFAQFDWCWVGVPKFWLADDKILKGAGKAIQIVWTGCTLTIKSDAKEIHEFVNKDIPTAFVTKWFGLSDLMRVCGSDARIVCYEPFHCNSFSAAVVMLRKLECDNVYIFGADGNPIDGRLHYSQEVLEAKYEWYEKVSAGRMMREMEEINLGFEYFCFKSEAEYPTKIINVTESSIITAFNKMTYEQFARYVGVK